MNVIILHGMPGKEEYYSEKYPSASNSHWIPWLQNQLLVNDIRTTTPEMFESFNPVYEKWKKEFERYDINEETILIGHSNGAGFIIRWISENKIIKVNKVILIAPWLDPNNKENNNFFDFKIDLNLASRTNNFLIFHSTNDDKEMQDTLEIIKREINDVKIRIFENYGHFCFSDMKTEKFPELLQEILNTNGI
jgi:predicted alpha/beta hydrolase family esterase